MSLHPKRRILPAACVVLMVVLGSLAGIGPAHAGDCGAPLNGKFTAFSDGQWAQTRLRYHDEASVTSTWTVSTSCADYLDCVGEVASDQGWKAPARCTSGMWIVARDVPNWEPCPDGTAVTGAQKFKFWAADPGKFTGVDKTVGPSGSCGVNRELTIEMPFTLTTLE